MESGFRMRTEARYTYQTVPACAFPLLGGYLPSHPVLQQMALRLCQDVENPSEEPNPQIDYRLLHILISMARRSLTKHDLKSFDYLAQCRKNYYRMQMKHESVHRELTDSNAYHVILNRKKKEVSETEPLDEGKVKEIDRQLMRNYEDLKRLVNEVQRSQQKRKAIAAFFSAAKVQILKTEVPRLVYVGQKVYENAMRSKELYLPLPLILPRLDRLRPLVARMTTRSRYFGSSSCCCRLATMLRRGQNREVSAAQTELEAYGVEAGSEDDLQEQ
ncbi:MAG: hypothetical protein Q9201_005831 [Fulgogasparrea decipioides]